MELLPDEIRAKLPELYTTEHDTDPVVQCKLFCPWNHWTWFVLEGEVTEYEDGGNSQFDSDYIFFGLVHGEADEYGYFRLSELESASGPFGLRIERDLYFTPCRMSEAKEELLRLLNI
jgi:hypothetical protein